MGTNSIRNNLDKDSMISDIKLCLSADINHECMHMVVEGEDDAKLLKNFVQKCVYIYESYSGKLGVIDIISHFHQKSSVIGICDRDYDASKCQDRIFLYDYSSMETMMLADPDVFQKIYDEFYTGSLECEELFLNIVENLKWLGCCRKLNHQHEWGLNLKAVNIPTVFDKKKQCIDVDKIITELAKSSPSFHDSKVDIIQLIDDELNKNTNGDIYKLVHGHDFVSLFHCICKKKKGRDPGQKGVSIGIRCAFSIDIFKRTQLYKELFCYQNNKCSCVFMC